MTLSQLIAQLKELERIGFGDKPVTMWIYGDNTTPAPAGRLVRTIHLSRQFDEAEICLLEYPQQ